MTLGAQNATDTAQTVTAKVTAPDGITVTPAEFDDLARRSRARHGAAARRGGREHEADVLHRKIALQTGSGQQLSPITVTVLVAPAGSLLRAFNNKGVSDDSNVNAANFDGGGWSYSAEALAAQGVTPDGTVTAGGITYTWPSSQPGEPDNAIAAGPGRQRSTRRPAPSRSASSARPRTGRARA